MVKTGLKTKETAILLDGRVLSIRNCVFCIVLYSQCQKKREPVSHHRDNITVKANQITTKARYNVRHRDINEMKKEWSGTEKEREIEAEAAL